MASQPALFLLIGFAGTGKLTVARALRDRLVARGQQVRLVDNHYVNNPIFQLLDVDGVKPLPEGAWDRVGEVRDAVVKTVEELSPRSWSFIFTNDLIERPEERAWVQRLGRLARRRRSAFIPVRLVCDAEEICRRIASPERHALMKSTSVEWIRRRLETEAVLDPHLSATLTLDVTAIPPDEAADRILAHTATVASRPARIASTPRSAKRKE